LNTSKKIKKAEKEKKGRSLNQKKEGEKKRDIVGKTKLSEL